MDSNQYDFLVDYQQLVNDCFEQIHALSEDKTMAGMAAENLSAMQKREVDLGLNLFSIISPVYHRENFHSDILREFLHPKGGHKEGSKYLEAFLHFLNRLGADIALPDYADADVVREEGRIDIAILDKTSGKAIIIENKINGAVDRIRQLPIYLDRVEEKWRFKCTKIVYLVLNRIKQPDMDQWSPKEKAEVERRLMVIPAYNETDLDLYTSWLAVAEQMASNADAAFVLRQYRQIIKKMGGNIMNKFILEQFYSEMLKGEKYKTALSIRSMIDDLILFRVERIIDQYRQSPQPFELVENYLNGVAIFKTCLVKNSNFSIDLIVQREWYSFQFWDRNYSGPGENPATQLLLLMEEDGFVPAADRMKKDFKFPDQEEELYRYIDTFKEKLKAAVGRY